MSQGDFYKCKKRQNEEVKFADSEEMARGVFMAQSQIFHYTSSWIYRQT